LGKEKILIVCKNILLSTSFSDKDLKNNYVRCCLFSLLIFTQAKLNFDPHTNTNISFLPKERRGSLCLSPVQNKDDLA
jgi:hypothetical protein